MSNFFDDLPFPQYVPTVEEEALELALKQNAEYQQSLQRKAEIQEMLQPLLEELNNQSFQAGKLKEKIKKEVVPKIIKMKAFL